MIVFVTRERGEAIFTSNGDLKLFGIFPNIPDIQERGVAFALLDIRKDKIVTITLPVQTAWELYNAGKIRFGR